MAAFVSNFDQWPADSEIFPLDRVVLPVLDGPHPFHIRHQDAITENWAREVAANPALFDGRMVLQRALRLDGDRLEGQAHIVPFSAFLWWRRTRPVDEALHLFGMPIILSSDGAVIAIRMGRHTANPGKVYCAGGSLDTSDVIDGFCDVAGNMAREVREETGLDLREGDIGDGFHALHHGGSMTLFRRYRFAETADALIQRIAGHTAGDAEPEIDEAVALRSADPGLHDYPPFMVPMLRWVLSASH